MSFTSRFFTLAALLIFAVSGLYAEDLYYVVKKGDTVSGIARSYKVNEKDILFLNGIERGGKIYAGQKLRIPGKTLMAPPIKAEMQRLDLTEYTAASGDTLWGIARKFGTSYKELALENNFGEKYVLKPGDKIMVPSKNAPEILPPMPASKPETGVKAQSAAGIQIAQNTNTQKAPLPPDAAAAAKSASATVASTPPKSAGASAVPVKSVNSASALNWPVRAKDSIYMTGKLSGIIIIGEKTEPVRSLTSGTVVYTGPYRGFGRVVIVKTDKGYDYVYGGCESVSVGMGDRVLPGSEVGKLGIDALSEKPQLFFLVYHNSKPVDPAKAPRAL